MSHFGAWITAYVDGQLTAAQAERLLSHASTCAPCARELAAERAAHEALLTTSDVRPSDDLTDRLMQVGRPSAGCSAARQTPHGLRPPAPAAPTHAALTGEVSGTGRRARVVRRVLTGALAGVVLAVAGLATLGRVPVVTVVADPGEALSVLSQAPSPRLAGSGTHMTTIGLPTRDSGDPAVAAGVDLRGWLVPEQLSDRWEVTGVRLPDGARRLLEIDLALGDATVVVREQLGRLDPAALADVPRSVVDGREVYVLSEDPWHVVWQADDIVLDVVTAADGPEVAQVVAALPSAEHDDGLAHRVARGWSLVLDALTGR